MNLLIKNVNIIDCLENCFGDVYIEDGIIKEIGKDLQRSAPILDGKGYKLIPAFVDLHTHFREPGHEYKEDIYTGSLAAIKGGYTTVNLMGNTNPPCSSNEVINYVLDKNEKVNLINVHQCATITKDIQGKSIEHLEDILKEGKVKFITDDGKGVEDNGLLIEAMNLAKKYGVTIISHAESEDLSNIDMRLAENTMTWRDITLAKYTKSKLHMAHVSTKEAMGYIIEAKEEGVDVTCEVTPHHLSLTKETSYRVNPPLREKEDVEFLIAAIKKGYVDAIGTDHAPHSEEDKLKGSPGMIGLESAFMVCYSTLVKGGHITLNELSRLMSFNPAKIMGLKSGKVSLDYTADLVLVDTEKEFEFNLDSINSKSSNSPYLGYKGYGKILATIKSGKIIYRDGAL